VTAHNPARTESNIAKWLWLLITAPGRVVMLHSPHSATEVLRRLHTQPATIKVISPKHFIIRLPDNRSPRCFFVWLEQDQTGRARLRGQMQTPFRAALTRSLLSLTLFWLGIVWLAAEKAWLGVIFMVGSIAFLLLSQYQRLTARDLPKYIQWLHRMADADEYFL